MTMILDRALKYWSRSNIIVANGEINMKELLQNEHFTKHTTPIEEMGEIVHESIPYVSQKRVLILFLL